MMKDPITIGRFGRVFGINGWIHVISFTRPLSNILDYQPWWVEDNDTWRELELSHTHISPKGIRVKLKDCHQPEEARCYVNLNIAIPKAALPETQSDDEHYWADLQGLTVKNQTGQILGVVDSFFETGANDVMVVKGEKERLIPYIKNTILAVDLKRKTIRVNWDASF